MCRTCLHEKGKQTLCPQTSIGPTYKHLAQKQTLGPQTNTAHKQTLGALLGKLTSKGDFPEFKCLGHDAGLATIFYVD